MIPSLHSTVMDLSVSVVCMWEICVHTYFKNPFASSISFFFPVTEGGRVPVEKADSPKTHSTRHCIQNVRVPTVVLHCLFPDTPHQLAQIKIYLMRHKHRGVKRGVRPEKGNGDSVPRHINRNCDISDQTITRWGSVCGGQCFFPPQRCP